MPRIKQTVRRTKYGDTEVIRKEVAKRLEASELKQAKRESPR